MPRKRKSSSANDNNNNDRRRAAIPEHIRQRQRAIAEREAARLAAPEVRSPSVLAHADRRKSAVTSTPFGIFPAAHDSEPVDTANKNAQEWCGPLSVARRMIAEREAARREELQQEQEQEKHPLDRPMEELAQEERRKKYPSLAWKASKEKEGKNKKNKQNRFPNNRRSFELSLYERCLDFVVEHFDCVESLGNFVDSSMRRDLARVYTARHGPVPATALAVLVQQESDDNPYGTTTPNIPTALDLPDASGITQDELVEALQKMGGQIEYLSLDLAGRCFGPRAVAALVEHANNNKNDKKDEKTTSTCRALSIGGAYLLPPDDCIRLVQAVQPASLQLTACPLLKGAALGQCLAHSDRLVELSLQDLDLGTDGLDALANIGSNAQPASSTTGSSSSSSSLRHLQSLSLVRLAGLSELHVSAMLATTQQSLQALDLSDNPDLGDPILDAIRSHATRRLQSLQLAGLRRLSPEGLEALFTAVDDTNDSHNDNGTTTDAVPLLPPRQLTRCHLGRLAGTTVTDALVQTVVQQNPRLQWLSLEGSTALTDRGLEALAAAGNGNHLATLHVSYCPEISNAGLGYLVDSSVHLRELEIWGCAQISNGFLDSSSRKKHLKITGAWMRPQSGEAWQ